jgi:hypothetical protein
MKTRSSLTLILAALLSLELASCLGSIGSSSMANGALDLHIDCGSLGSGAKTIAPDVGSWITQYIVTLSKAGSSDVKARAQATSTLISSLEAGSWTIAVSGLDSGGNVIALGRGSVDIAAGATKSATVVLAAQPPTSGTGGIKVTLRYAELAMVSEVVPVLDGVPSDLQDGVETSSAIHLPGTDCGDGSYQLAYENSSVAAGSRLLRLVFRDDSYSMVSTASLVESILVYPGKTTEVTLVNIPGDIYFEPAPTPPYEGATLLYYGDPPAFGYAPSTLSGLVLHTVSYAIKPARYYPVISWTPSAAIYSKALDVGYEIQYSSDKKEYVPGGSTGSYGSSYADTSWGAGGARRYYRVVARNHFGESTTVCEGSQPPVPPSPNAFKVNTYGDYYQAVWDTVPDSAENVAPTYRLYAYDTINKTYYLIVDGATMSGDYDFTQAQMDMIAPHKNHMYFVVSALYGDEESDISEQMSSSCWTSGYNYGSGSDWYLD